MDKINEAGLQLIAVSYDPVKVLKDYAEKNDIAYPLLSDVGSKTIDTYGIRNEAMDGKKFGPNDLTGIPHPGTYIVGTDGKIKAKLFLKRYQDRHSVDDIVEAAKEVLD